MNYQNKLKTFKKNAKRIRRLFDKLLKYKDNLINLNFLLLLLNKNRYFLKLY